MTAYSLRRTGAFGSARADGVLRGDGVWISADPGNGDWRDYLAWIADGNTASPPSVDLAAYAAQIHVAYRDGGVTIAGMLVKTDSESRGLIAGAYSLSEVRPDATIDFKAASGWVSLSSSQMQTIAVAIGSWVQACYSAYRGVSSAIGSGAITTPAQIDAAFAAVTLPS